MAQRCLRSFSSSARRVKVCLLAGEASGDAIGSGLIRAMSALASREGTIVDFCGVGGVKMDKAGFKSVFSTSELSVMGFLPVLRRLLSFYVRVVFLLRSSR
eukprot:GILK01011828.1.p1 GENE.GILK01011828.1~~GILK01011828.1.p1  ORF type:complete len:111 (+),score=10.62 GILK01011828.1:33-335(+)